MVKNLFSGIIFATTLGPQNLFRDFYLNQILGTAASYNCMQFQGKLSEPNLRKLQKT